jgi:putative hemolysin
VDPALWTVVLATVLSGFIALNSFSLRTFSRSRLEELLPGARGKRRLELLEQHLKPLRLTLTLCRSLANLVLVAGMVRWMRVSSSDWGLILQSVALAGAVITVFGVAIPHAWATYSGERILASTFPLLMLLRYALWPITAIMQSFDLPVRRLSGQTEDEEENGDAAKQEILLAATDGRAEGAVDDAEVEMIESVMEFAETDAAEIMTPRTDIFALSSETPLVEAARKIQQAGHSRVPVYRENLDQIVGIIYAKDLLACVGSDQPASLVDLTRKPFFVPETKPLDGLLREFKSRKVHIAVVLDEYGGTAGLVSIEDVLEEIVGDISDEYDAAQTPQIKRINESTVEIDGRLRIDELNDLLELELPEDEDFDTVAGFVYSELGYIPVSGEAFSTESAEFTVLEADERRIIKLRVRKLQLEEQEL